MLSYVCLPSDTVTQLIATQNSLSIRKKTCRQNTLTHTYAHIKCRARLYTSRCFGVLQFWSNILLFCVLQRCTTLKVIFCKICSQISTSKPRNLSMALQRICRTHQTHARIPACRHTELGKQNKTHAAETLKSSNKE